MMRQICKQILTIVLLLGAVAPAAAQSVVTTIVTNPLTGVALDGFDPVSFFTDPRPSQGKADFEYVWAGVPWYFTNAANRDAFVSAPEAYAPQFGGHCAMSLSRGFLSDGNPRYYVVRDRRLYLFYSPGNLDAFNLSPLEALVGAYGNWPAFSAQLTTK